MGQRGRIAGRGSSLLPAAGLGLTLVGGAPGCLGDDEKAHVLLPSGIVGPRIDMAEEGELAGGGPRPFGLELPRGMKVKARFKDAWYTRGDLPRESVANFIRDRIEPVRTDTGPHKTVFVDARITAGQGDRRVRIEVSGRGRDTEVVVRDRTPKPVEPGLTPKERWRRAGIDENGRVLPSEAK
ncbi:MAG: hypothetical protein AAGA56_07420 [Myxococcota bacterium]